MDVLEYSDYKNQRDKLLDKAEGLINGGVHTKQIEADIQALFDEVDQLDAKYNSPTNKANIEALKDKHSISPKAMGLFENNNKIGVNNMNKDNQYREQFFNAMQGKLSNASLVRTGTGTGSHVIPETTWDGIIAGVRQTNGIVSDCRILTIPGDFRIPTEATRGKATFKGENQESPDASSTFGAKTLQGKELMKLISMSATVDAMSMDAFERYITEELTFSIQEALNEAIWKGDPTTQLSGILRETYDTSNKVEFTNVIKPATLMEAVGKMPSNYRAGSKFYMNSVTYFTLMSYEDSAGNAAMVNSLSENPKNTLIGQFEFKIDDSLPNDVIMLVNPMYYFLNFSKPMEIARDTSVGFKTGEILYRALSVVDGCLASNKASVMIVKQGTDVATLYNA